MPVYKTIISEVRLGIFRSIEKGENSMKTRLRVHCSFELTGFLMEENTEKKVPKSSGVVRFPKITRLHRQSDGQPAGGDVCREDYVGYRTREIHPQANTLCLPNRQL